jgi:ribonuclease P protein component
MRQKTASFRKGERLCGVKAISRLFAEGSTFAIPPVRVMYMTMPADSDMQTVRVLVSVPKRYFKKAVDRNLIRRRIREAYRKNKEPLLTALSGTGKRIDLAITWTDTAIRSYSETEKAVKDMMQRLSSLK